MGHKVSEGSKIVAKESKKKGKGAKVAATGKRADAQTVEVHIIIIFSGRFIVRIDWQKKSHSSAPT